MATNTASLKTFAQQTRAKLISLVQTKLRFVLTADSAELRGFEAQIDKLRKEIASKTEKIVVEEVAYTWFNRVMALRFMDANGYNAPMVVSPAPGQTRPEILQDAMGGSIDDDLGLSTDDKLLPEAKLYRRLLIAVCNQKNAAMPFLFERIADYSELLLPDDLLSDQSFVNDILRGMTDEDCGNVELMGWLYQFYIIDRKADAETKKSKKGGLKSDEQAAATQLFTPHWIVRYMVENTLGKIWMTLHPESNLIHEMPYYIQSPEGQVDPIPEDIRSAADIRFIDPCMGSGHVLVYAFDLFTKMYEEEGALHRDIPNQILTNNIFGIDIDPRCYQLASFALTMKARAYHSRYLRRTVSPNVIALQNIDYDTIESAGNWEKDSLMWQFENIDTIGSLLKIPAKECAAIHVESGLFMGNQQLLKKQAEFISGSYHCVVTNPPYLGKGFGDALKIYVQKVYPNSKADIMATFMERCLELCSKNGKMAMINMHSWMFLSSYEKLRSVILENFNIDSLLHLGPRTFDEISGEVVQNAAFVVANHIPDQNGGTYFRLVDGKNCAEKENSFLLANREKTHGVYFEGILQNNFEKIPGSPIGYWVSEKMVSIFENAPIKNFFIVKEGLKTGDNNRFIRYWPEISHNKINIKWFSHTKGGEIRRWYGNNSYVLNFENDGQELKDFKGATITSPENFFKEYVSYGRITAGKFSSRYTPERSIPNMAGLSILTKEYNVGKLESLCLFTNTKIFQYIINLINPTLNNPPGVITNIPYLTIDDTSSITKECIAICKRDWDAHETSWDFQNNEIVLLKTLFKKEGDTQNNFKLSALVNAYKTYWEERFMQLHANEEELNRQFIESYGLQDELTPDVPLKEITILQKGEITIEDNKIVWHEDVVLKQLISYLVGCYMGRYSVDKPGLIIASQGQDLSTLGLEVEGIADTDTSTIAIDDDGIIPFIQEPDFFADDITERVEMAVKKLFGEDNYHENLKYINNALGCELREYLFKTFYADHVQMYSKRPIYWLFSSKMGDKKKKGYFKALVYMHRIESDTLSKLHADYVHPYIEKVEMHQKEAENEASRDDLTTAQRNKAIKLADELKDKVREVRAFEQQLVEMASHRLNINLDDGVKANYPKFYPLVEPIKGLESNDD